MAIFPTAASASPMTNALDRFMGAKQAATQARVDRATRELMPQAAAGNPEALQQLMGVNPQAGMQIQGMMAQQEQARRQQEMHGLNKQLAEMRLAAAQQPKRDIREVGDALIEVTDEGVTELYGGGQDAKWQEVDVPTEGGGTQKMLIDFNDPVNRMNLGVTQESQAQESEFLKEMDKKDAASFTQWRDDAFRVTDTMDKLDVLAEAVAAKAGGSKVSSAARRTLAAAGWDGTPQTFDAAVNALVLDGLSKLKGAISEKELEFVKEQYPQFSTNPAAATAIINRLRNEANRVEQRYTQAHTYLTENKNLRGFKFEEPESKLSITMGDVVEEQDQPAPQTVGRFQVRQRRR